MSDNNEKIKLYSTSEILLFFLKNSPLWLLLSLTIGFILSGTFLFEYYTQHLLNNFFNSFTLISLSFFAAIMFQLLRFSFALSGSADYASGNDNGKKWGFTFSAFITIWELVEVYHASIVMTEKLNLQHLFWSLYMFIFAVILFPFIAEIRLTLQLANSLKKEKIKQSITNETGEKEFKRLGEIQRIEYLRLSIEEFKEEKGRTPSIRETADLIGASTSTASKYLLKIKPENEQ